MPHRPIDIKLLEEMDNLWRFAVTVGSTEDSTKHTVTISKDYWQQITGPAETPQSLLQRSFEFLLEREPKESILKTFDLSVIQRYFPEYESEIKK